MREMPLVTLGIICYNHENYLKDCLKSILDQDYCNIEVIINDDCSKDSSVSIIRDYAPLLKKKFVSVQCIENEANQGICKSVNNIIRRAKGKYVKLLASDDLMHFSCISSLVAFMEEQVERIVCFTNGFLVGENYHYGDKVQVSQVINTSSFSLEHNNLFKKLMKGNFINTVGMMIRKEAYEKYGLYDEGLRFEDYDMWLRLARFEKFGYINAPLVYYRRGDSSLTNIHSRNAKNKFKFMVVGTREIFEKHLKYIDKMDRSHYRKYFYNHILRDIIKYDYFDLFYKWVRLMQKKNIILEDEIYFLLREKKLHWKIIYRYFKFKCKKVLC
ncbi:MAG: hypothetical protein K0S61_2038 [Anaerocolumna sp.]|jgi:glycosyltransferase involved in cell wall biosynthesis|nr:hypothetical protein [Anaerocolumna sp.]